VDANITVSCVLVRSARAALFDHLVGAQQEQFRDRQAKHLCGGQVEDKIELGRLFDRQVGRLRPP
jgi:hypothetical protein